MSGEPSSKKVKIETIGQVLDDNAEQNDNEMAIAVPAPPVAQENRCEIFKLDVDCCEEIFEWLSIADLHSFGQTCKRMNRIAGMYFRQNYSNAEIYSASDGIYLNFPKIKINGFSEFIENITVSTNEMIMNQLTYIGTNCKSLKKIRSCNLKSEITNGLDVIRDVLPSIESISIYFTTFPDKAIFNFCPNLTHVTVGWKNTDWLFELYKCPKLEFISLENVCEQVNVDNFFDQIPNIRSITVNSKFILCNKDALLNSNVKLENLMINWADAKGVDQSIFDILNEFYNRGFYKRLHFIDVGVSDIVDQQFVNGMARLCALETLDIGVVEMVDWPVMPSIKNMVIIDLKEFDLETFVSKIPNLQRIELTSRCMERLLPLCRQLKKLSTIYVPDHDEEEFDEDTLDLSTLNRERKKLMGACKVTIYVPEDTFLEAKFENGVNCNLVEIKRKESLKRNDNDWHLG